MASKINVDKIARGSGTPEFTIPTADGAADTFLKTDGSGVLSFDSVTTTALTGSTNTWIPTITAANALTGTANFTYDGNTLDVKNSGTASSINLYCETGNAHYIKIKSGPHASATSYTLTMPNAPPSVSGQALTATTAGVASWAAAGSDNTPAFLARLSANQSIPNATWTKLEVDTERYDTDNAYDNSTNYRFTVPVGAAGAYLFNFGTQFNNISGGAATQTVLYVNGTFESVSPFRSRTANDFIDELGASAHRNLLNSSVMLLAEGDYVELWTAQMQGSSQNAGSDETYFAGFKLAGVS